MEENLVLLFCTKKKLLPWREIWSYLILYFADMGFNIKLLHLLDTLCSCFVLCVAIICSCWKLGVAVKKLSWSHLQLMEIRCFCFVLCVSRNVAAFGN